MSKPQRIPPVIKKAIGITPILLSSGQQVGANDFYKPNFSFWSNPAKAAGDVTIKLFATTAEPQFGTPPEEGPDPDDTILVLNNESYLIIPVTDYFDEIVLEKGAKFFSDYEIFDPKEQIFAIASAVGVQVRIAGGKDSING